MERVYAADCRSRVHPLSDVYYEDTVHQSGEAVWESIIEK
jgi:hypothetical protein